MSQEVVNIAKLDGVTECEVIKFSIKANNGLADSPAGTVTGGFPIGKVLVKYRGLTTDHLLFNHICRPQFI